MPRPRKIADDIVRTMPSVSAKTAKAVQDDRSGHRISTASEAIRRLTEAGLERLASKPNGTAATEQ